MEKKPSLKVYYTETETHFVQKIATIVNEDTHPELKGMSLEEMKKYVEENMGNMKSIKSDYYSTLEDEVMYAEEEWDRYYNESSECVIEEATENDVNEYGSQSNHEDDDEDEASDDDDFDDDDE